MAFLSGFLKKDICKGIAVVITVMCSLTILSAQENFNNFSRAGEFLIDTVIRYSFPFYYQNHPAVAFDGTNYLVLWDHNWNDGGDLGRIKGIFGTRVTPSGIVLDSGGILISSNGIEPSVAFDGTNYMIVWSAGGIFCSRLNADGIIIDPEPIVINADTNLSNSSIAFDGVNYCVVWTQSGGEYPYFWYNTYGTRVTPEGIILDPQGFLIADGCCTPSIAFGDSMYFVACVSEWEQFYFSINGVRVNLAGQILDSIPITISPWWMGMGQVDPDIIYGSSNYLIVWSSGNHIWSKKVNNDGVVLDSVHIELMSGERPSVTYNNTDYFVTADRATSGVYGVRVDTLGVIIDTMPILISDAPSFQWYSDVAFDDSNFFAVWRDERRGLTQKNIYGARVTQGGNLMDPDGIAISTSANEQEFSGSAYNSNTGSYFHVWRDSRNISSDIYGIHLDSIGNALDTSIVITTANREQTNPAIASTSAQFLCVWQDCRIDTLGSDIYGARIDSSGLLLNPSGILISAASNKQSNPAVASCGSNYFVVWQDQRDYDAHPDIYGARVSLSGAVLDPNGIFISIQTIMEHTTPAVAFDGSNYLVVWNDAYYGWDIHGVRIDTLGNILVPFMVISSATNWQYSPAVAFNGNSYMVVWEDDRNGSDFRDIFGTVVDTSGYVVYPDGFPISIVTGQQRYPSISYDGTNYLVTWQDNRNDEWDIYGAKVNSNGQVLNTYIISNDDDNQNSPVLVKADDDRIFITWSGWTDSINGRPANTMRIWGKMYPFTEIAEDNGNIVQKAIDGLVIYPNPFVKMTNIKFQISGKYQNQNADQKISLKIYDVSGRIVRLFNYSTDQSFNQLTWQGDDNSGQRLSAGIYFIQLTYGNHNQIRKVVLLE